MVLIANYGLAALLNQPDLASSHSVSLHVSSETKRKLSGQSGFMRLYRSEGRTLTSSAPMCFEKETRREGHEE